MVPLAVLQQGLSEFGLDPKDWDVTVLSRLGEFSHLEVRSRDNQTLCLTGWAKSAIWMHLWWREY